MSVQSFEAIDAGIRQTSSGSVSTRNAMRDSASSVLRESLRAGILTYDKATPMLYAVAPEQQVRDDEKQARGHVPADQVEKVFHELAQDQSVTARRDTALIALPVGAGLRRAEVVSIDLKDMDTHFENVVFQGKGGVVRTVPLAPGVRRALRALITVRSDEPGPLSTPITRKLPVQGDVTKRMAPNTVARRFGANVKPHDLRRTFTGDLLESVADFSVVSKVLEHVNPATTAGYDRRSQAARLAAVEKLHVPFES